MASVCSKAMCQVSLAGHWWCRVHDHMCSDHWLSTSWVAHYPVLGGSGSEHSIVSTTVQANDGDAHWWPCMVCSHAIAFFSFPLAPCLTSFYYAIVISTVCASLTLSLCIRWHQDCHHAGFERWHLVCGAHNYLLIRLWTSAYCIRRLCFSDRNLCDWTDDDTLLLCAR